LGIGSLLALGLALVFAATALAAPKGVVGDFGSAGTGNGQFTTPRGVAVNQSTGDVYVVDSGNNRIQRFNADGDYLSQFGSTGSGNGQFSTAVGIAIDPTSGAVYVSDQGNRRVQKFDASGSFLRMWGWGVQNGAAAFQICTNLQTCQIGTSGSAGGQFGTTIGRPVVDPSNGNVYVGDATNRRIQVFDSSGNFLRLFGWDVVTTGQAGDVGTNNFEICISTAAGVCKGGSTAAGSANGQFGSNQPVHLAIDSSGATHVLFASDANPTTSTQRVQRFDVTAPGTPAPMTPIASPPLLSSGVSTTSGLAMDPVTNHLLVVRDPTTGDTVVQEFNTPSEAVAPAAVSDTHASGEGFTNVDGVATKGSNGRVYVTRSNVNQVAILNTGGVAATATLNATSAITATTATLNGTVNPGGFAHYRFQYRVCAAPPCASGAFTLAPVPDGTLVGTANVGVSQAITGLVPATTYEVQLIADGTGAPVTNPAVPATFTTASIAPTVSNRPASLISDITAQLQADVNPNNLATTYRFEYLTDAEYKANGNSYSGANVPAKAPAPDGSLGSGAASLVVSQTIGTSTPLTPSTAYHFRVVAINSTGTTNGVDQTFTTEATPTPPAGEECANEALRTGASTGLPECRAYELVSPADKPTGPGIGLAAGSSNGDDQGGAYSGVSSTSGDRYISGTTYGALLSAEGNATYTNDVVLGERTSSGWVNKDAYNMYDYAPNSYKILFGLRAFNESLSLLYFGSGGGYGARLFPETAAFSNEEGALSKYVRDWGGAWRLIAPVSASGPGSSNNVTSLSLAEDGKHLTFTSANKGTFGSEDPSADQVSGNTAYSVDLTGGIANSYAARGGTSLLATCTGGGAARTVIPSVGLSGTLGARTCPAPLAGRSAALIDSRGSAIYRPPGRGDNNNVIAADGSRAFFLSPDPDASSGLNSCSGTGSTTACPAQLYVRQENPDGSVTTRWVSRPQVENQSAALLGPAYFQGASNFGDKVFFETTSPLTADDPNGGSQVPGGVTAGSASNSSWDLYEYEIPSAETGHADGSDPANGRLVRVSAGPLGTGDCNVSENVTVTRPPGALRFLAQDGTRVYFTCTAPLPGVPAPSNGTITSPGGTVITNPANVNLYLYDANKPLAKRWEFISQLPWKNQSSSAASCASSNGSTSSSSYHYGYMGTVNFDGTSFLSASSCLSGTDDGRFVTFFTTGKLTADDPNTTTGDIYAYDGGKDELVRITAPQGGSGGSYMCDSPTSLQCYGTGSYSNSEVQGDSRGVATDPAVATDRIAFFQSKSNLVPGDTDGLMDVYQWRNGKLRLISGGITDTSAMYASNDASGRNVFVMTHARLTHEDIDGVRDIYDARVGGGFPEPPPVVTCDVLGDACQGSAPESLPAAPSPASATSTSGGNAPESKQKKHRPKGKKKHKGKKKVSGAKGRDARGKHGGGKHDSYGDRRANR
jgi:hypothetical protein